MKRIFTTIIMLVIAFIVNAQPGANDLTFNPGDVGFGNGDGFDNGVLSLAIQTDGKIITAGNFTSYNGTTSNRIVRVNTDGTIDSNFNTGTGFTSSVISCAIQSDGKIIVGGYFTYYNNSFCSYIVRLNSDGSLDNSFNIGTGFDNSVLSISIQPDDKIIVGGNFTSFNGQACNRVVRLNANGSIDSSFNTGTGFNNNVQSLAIQPDGKIIASGNFISFNGQASNRLVRLNANGSIDNSFNIGTGFNSQISSLAIQSDGRIIVGGSFTSYNGTALNRIVCLKTDGSIDNSFSIGTGLDKAVLSLAVQSDDKIIAAGHFSSYNGTVINRILRLNSDGSLDNSFNIGTGADNSVWSLCVRTDGKIIAGGHFSSFNETICNYIVCLNTDGSIDNLFYSEGTGFNRNVRSLATQTDGKIIAGGDFTSYNGTLNKRIVCLNPDGTADNSFITGTGFNGIVNSINIQPDGKILAGGSFQTYNDISVNRIARINANGSLDQSFNIGTGFNSPVSNIAMQSDGKIIVGGMFTNYNGNSIKSLVRLNTDGSIDNTFTIGTGFNSSVQSLAIQSDGKVIVGGYFTTYNDTPQNYIVRLHSDGSLDESFNIGAGFNNIVQSVAIQSDGKIITGGNFTSYNGNLINRILRLNTDGSLDNSFNIGTGVDNLVWSLGIQSNGKIIAGGNFTSFNEVSRNHMVRLNTDGSIDDSFNIGTGFNSTVLSLTFQSDGRIIAGGGFTSYSDIGRNRIARLLSDCVNAYATDVISVCEPYTWIDGVTYTESNNTATFTILGGSANGCDSIITLDLIIHPTYEFVQNAEVCIGDSFSWRGNIYTTAGTYYDNLLSVNNCDSVYVLNLTVHPTYEFVQNEEICNGVSFSWRGNTYTEAGTYYDNLLTVNNCDSVYMLNLTVNPIPPTPTITLTGNVMSSDAPIGNQWYDQNGTIIGANNQDYIFTNVGDYYATVTLLGCTSTPSNTISVMVTEIELIEDSITLAVYPNPVSEILTIEFIGNSKTVNFEIFNAVGQVTLTGYFVDRITIPTSDFIPGIYILKLQKNKTFEFFKIIKE